MGDIADDVKSKLSDLNPAVRARVENALKETIDREIAASGGPAGARMAFSRGIFFSKSGARASLEETILPAVTEMDEAKFKTFMDRIATLKKMNPGGGA